MGDFVLRPLLLFEKERKALERYIKSMTDNHREDSLDFVDKVFTEYRDSAEGKLVRALVKEIRQKKYYLPELELMMTDENDEIIGYAMYSRFHIEGKYEDTLLILTPVAVKTELQRQHISKELIEYGFLLAREKGYTAVIVEGNPANYRARGFVTAAEHGILPGKTVHLPSVECLMVKELVPGALSRIHGTLEYDFYKALL